MSNMTNRDAWVEICVQVMGKELGDLFGLLCKELWGLNDEVSTYIDLFYLSPEDSKLLESAPAFFGIVQTLLQENMALRITRLSDPAAWKTKGEQQPNLTLSKLVEIIGNTHTSPTDLVQVNEKFLEKIKTELFPQITDMLANVKEAAKPFKTMEKQSNCTFGFAYRNRRIPGFIHKGTVGECNISNMPTSHTGGRYLSVIRYGHARDDRRRKPSQAPQGGKARA